MFHTLLLRLNYYFCFDVDDFTGTALTRDEVIEQHYERLQTLQVVAYKFFSPTLRPFSLRNVGSIEERRALRSNLALLAPEELCRLARHLNLLGEDLVEGVDPEVILEAILLLHEKRPSKSDHIVSTALYPQENVLWQSATTSAIDCLGQRCTALPKLNLQFLSFFDYLERNYTLYQQEAMHSIRYDLEDVIQRLAPRKVVETGKPELTGWARMGSPVFRYALDNVRKPNLGDTVPSQVSALVDINLAPMRPEIRDEWMLIKPPPERGAPDCPQDLVYATRDGHS